MFERYTERARQVLVLAQEEALIYKHSEVTVAHLLTGLTRETGSVAERVLEQFGITTAVARQRFLRRTEDALEAKFLTSTDAPEANVAIPCNSELKKVLELALREALSLGHNYIGTEHLLLALLRVPDGRDLFNGIASEEEVRQAVWSFLDPKKKKKAEAKPKPEPDLSSLVLRRSLETVRDVINLVLETLNEKQGV